MPARKRLSVATRKNAQKQRRLAATIKEVTHLMGRGDSSGSSKKLRTLRDSKKAVVISEAWRNINHKISREKLDKMREMYQEALRNGDPRAKVLKVRVMAMERTLHLKR